MSLEKKVDAPIRFEDIEEETEVTTKTIMIIGLSGSGKSAMIDIIGNPGVDFKSDDTQIRAVTNTKYMSVRRTNKIKIKGKEFLFEFIDTVGFGDPTHHDNPEAVMNEWNKYVDENNTKIHYVIFVMKPDRVRVQVQNDIQYALNYLEIMGVKKENCFIVMNFTELYTKAALDRYESELFNYPIIKKMYNMSKTSIRCCFARDDEIRDEFKGFIRDQIKESKAKVLNELIKPSLPVAAGLMVRRSLEDKSKGGVCVVQ